MGPLGQCRDIVQVLPYTCAKTQALRPQGEVFGIVLREGMSPKLPKRGVSISLEPKPIMTPLIVCWHPRPLSLAQKALPTSFLPLP